MTVAALKWFLRTVLRYGCGNQGHKHAPCRTVSISNRGRNVRYRLVTSSIRIPHGRGSFGHQLRWRCVLEWVQHIESRHLRSFAVRQLVKALLDVACCLAAVGIALALDEGTRYGWRRSGALGAAVALTFVACHMLLGSYRSIWRYTSVHEAMAICASSGVVFLVLMLASWLEFLALPASTILLIALLILFCCTALRVLRRWQVAEARGRVPVSPTGTSHRPPRRLLIVGAGEHGLSMGREIIRTATHGVELVGFLDDDPSKSGAALQGVPVLGPVAEALSIAERLQVSEVIVAMPSAEPGVVRTFVRRLEDAGIRVRAVAGLERFVLGGAVHRPGTATLNELLGGLPPGARAHGGGDRGLRHVLITGGAGFIGSHVTKMLLDRGYHVRILERFLYGRNGIAGIASHPRLEILPGDICNSRDVSRAVRDVDGVLALAAIVGDPACSLDPEETINLNYAASKILIETCNLYSVRRVVFASSCSVYGASNHDSLTERSRLNPVSLYARTRVLSENILFDRRGDVEPVVLRLATAFGLSPRMRFDLVVNTLTARAVVDKKIVIFGGNQWRPHVHCWDAARAFILALEAPAAAVAGEVFNVGGDAQNHRIDKLGDIVAQCVEGIELVRQNDVADPRDYRVSFAKIRRILGFQPEISVAQGIREVAAAVRSNPAWQRYDDPAFHNVHALKRTFTAWHRSRSDADRTPTLVVA